MAGVAYDIESLGVTPGSIIVSIGAVRFNDHGIIRPDYEHMTTDEILRSKQQNEFYAEIAVASTGALGMTFSNDTLAWWMDQPDAVRATLTRALRAKEGAVDIRQALGDFRAWLEIGEGMQHGIWSWHGFDHTLTKTAYARMGIDNPWSHKLEFDAYTLASACKAVPAPNRQGTHHNALDDAKWCARYVVSLKQYMKKAAQGASMVAGMEMQAELQRGYAGPLDEQALQVASPMRDAYGFEVKNAEQTAGAVETEQTAGENGEHATD